IQRYGNDSWKISADDPRWVQERYWLHYAEGSLMPLLVMKLVFSRIPKSPMPFIARPVAKGISGKVIGTFIDPQLENQLAVIEAHLGTHSWFTGDTPSAADIII
ncbi:MAG TPA: glutathione S-transferase, partial [Alcanivorax sp.]|nr:glutathione S-transferase [Alcanivorax sp.]